MQKAISSLEIDRYSLDGRHVNDKLTLQKLKDKLRTNCWDKIWYIAEALRRKMSTQEIYSLTKIDPWFLDNIKDIVKLETQISIYWRGEDERCSDAPGQRVWL